MNVKAAEALLPSLCVSQFVLSLNNPWQAYCKSMPVTVCRSSFAVT